MGNADLGGDEPAGGTGPDRAAPAISPDGRTLYVSPASPSGDLIPVDVASRGGEGDPPHGQAGQIVVSPEGRTVYTVATANGTVRPG